MSNKLPISVFIIAKNEEDRIAKSISSVRDFVDEVIVIDSGSTDKTIEISKSLGASTYLNEWEGYLSQKKYGESLCKNKWILNIDADEEVSDSLKEEIQNLFLNGEPQHKAYHVKIKIIHRAIEDVKAFAPTNNPIRFYHTDFASFAANTDFESHDSVVIHPDKKVDDLISELNHPIYHRSLKSIFHAIEKANFCTSEQARDLYSAGRNPSNIRLVLEPIFTFFKAYILRRYFIYGIEGFIDSIIFAFSRFIRLAKSREIYQKESKKN
jgi:glycosyltransferase involved in cell wall biosynthesis